ncbi:MAG: ATP-binding cassette domain-containing protein [Limisphaerales bacterium]
MFHVAVGSAFRAEEIVINQVDWQVAQHEFWVIGGLHGSGKTDLLMTAGALQRPIEGKVFIFGKEQGNLHEHELLEERRRIGVVFENGGRMFRQLTVWENVALPLRYHENLSLSDSEERIEWILQNTGLSDYAHNTIATLSPPWQQRVGLARALALKPDLLLIDKPSIGARYLSWWQEFLHRLAAGHLFRGHRVSTVMTTDDFRDWANLGTHFAMVKNKRWHLLGGKADLNRSQEELWRDLTSEISI